MKLHFDAQGGAVDPDEIEVTYDAAVGTLPSPTRAGYSLRWFTETNGTGMEYTAATVYNVIGDLNLYAAWTANTYTLYFDAQGGAVNPDEIEVTYDAAVGTLPSPTRAGYAFAGWFTLPDGHGDEYTGATTYGTADHLMLYAYWFGISRITVGGEAAQRTDALRWQYRIPCATASQSVALNVETGSGYAGAVVAIQGQAGAVRTLPEGYGEQLLAVEVSAPGLPAVVHTLTVQRPVPSDAAYYRHWDDVLEVPGEIDGVAILSVVWYRNGVALDETALYLTLTESGDYHAVLNGGALETCPLTIDAVSPRTLRVYPNPATDAITLESDEPLGVTDIFNTAGERIYRNDFREQTRVVIPVSDFPKGVCLIRTGGKTLKLVIND
jgi:uncharacterized repeat protein (TIGR02543 family)